MQRINAIRLRVFLQSFGMPILWLIVFFIRLSHPTMPFRSFVSLGLVIFSIGSLLLSETVYLVSLAVHEKQLTITYLNRFMQKRTRTLPMEDIITLNFHKKAWLLDYPTSVTIEYAEETKKFRLLTHAIQEEVKALMSLRENEKQMNLSVN